MDASADPCPFCSGDGGTVLWRGRGHRVVLAEEAGYPGFCRVVLDEHRAEMSDLEPAQAEALLHTVLATERALRATLAPDKINLASLGNVVPHLHWHVIPRWRDDRHFPRPIWAEPLREGAPRTLRPDFVAHLRAALTRTIASPP